MQHTACSELAEGAQAVGKKQETITQPRRGERKPAVSRRHHKPGAPCLASFARHGIPRLHPSEDLGSATPEKGTTSVVPQAPKSEGGAGLQGLRQRSPEKQ